MYKDKFNRKVIYKGVSRSIKGYDDLRFLINRFEHKLNLFGILDLIKTENGDYFKQYYVLRSGNKSRDEPPR